MNVGHCAHEVVNHATGTAGSVEVVGFVDVDQDVALLDNPRKLL